MRPLQYLKNVATLKLDAEKCTGCRECLRVCPQEVFARHERKVRVANLDNCMECGACQRNCQYGAIQVNAGVGCAAAIIGTYVSGGGGCCG